MVRLKRPRKRICSVCGKTFGALFAQQRYCSEKCRKEGERRKNRERYKRNPSRHISHTKKTYWKYHKKYLKAALERHHKLKLLALQKVSKSLTPKCSRCGCDNLSILELAHINHDGKFEKGRTHLLEQVARGKRSSQGLKVLCKLCNQLEDIEHRFGEIGYQIIWHPS